MVNWSELFAFSVNPLEIFVRGTVIYWFIFFLFRFFLRRDIGSIAITDVMLLVLIADAASNGMSGGYESITDGCILVATLAGWNYVLNWISFHFPVLRRLIQPPPLAVVRNGKMQRKAMRQELITVEELQSKLREQGIENLGEIKVLTLKRDAKSRFTIRKPGIATGARSSGEEVT